MVALGWVVVFTAILGHLPALASFFYAEDWLRLARAAGRLETAGVPPRPVSDLIYWKAIWPLFGPQSPPYHGLALLLAAVTALLSLRLARRLGLGPAGQVVAGLVVAGSPVLVGPIFWASATGELLAAVLALVALECWLSDRGDALPVAVVAGAAAILSADAALLLPLVLVLAGHWVAGPSLRGRRAVAWLALLAVAGWEASLVLDSSTGGEWSLADVGAAALTLGGWLISPWTFSRGQDPGLQFTGLAVWTWWIVQAIRHRDPAVRVGLVLALTTAAAALLHPTQVAPLVLTLAIPAWGWFLAAMLAPRLDSMLAALRERRDMAWGSLALVVAAGLVAVVAWSATRARLTERGPDGILTDPIARGQATAAESVRLLRQLPRSPSGQIRILQATRIEPPTDFAPPEGEDFVFASPLHVALSGTTGLALSLGDQVQVSWSSHLDGVPPGTQVLLDAGDASLRPLGPIENARMYSALIAIAAGQYERARHDLWAVTGREGFQIPFHYEAAALPVTVDELDAQSAGFVKLLRAAGDDASNLRILNLFEQLYEAVTGEDLYRTPWGEPLKG